MHADITPTEMPSSVEGTVVNDLIISRWPYLMPTLISALEISGGLVRLTGLPNGRLKAEIITVIENYETAAHVLESCPLIMKPNMDVGIGVTWNSNGITLCINGMFVASTATRTLEFNPQICELPQRISPPSKNYDRENKWAVIKRRSAPVGWQTIPGRQRAGKNYVFSALQNEILQLEDLLTLVREGRPYHIAGIASRLRLLVATGRPMPLLQLAISFADFPLIVYTSPNPDARSKPEGDDFTPMVELSSLISAIPVPTCNNPVDIDVWLNQFWERAGGKTLTNRKLLEEFGNTFGSHVDLDLMPSVTASKALAMEINGISEDFVVHYLTRVAETITVVGQSALRRLWDWEEKMTQV